MSLDNLRRAGVYAPGTAWREILEADAAAMSAGAEMLALLPRVREELEHTLYAASCEGAECVCDPGDPCYICRTETLLREVCAITGDEPLAYASLNQSEPE